MLELQGNAPYYSHPTNFSIYQLYETTSTQQPMQQHSTYICANSGMPVNQILMP